MVSATDPLDPKAPAVSADKRAAYSTVTYGGAAAGDHLHAGPRRERGFWAGWARIVTTRRWLSLLAAVVALGVFAIPVASMRTTLVQPDAAGTIGMPRVPSPHGRTGPERRTAAGNRWRSSRSSGREEGARPPGS